MKLALDAILLEAKNKYGNIRSKESLSLLEELRDRDKLREVVASTGGGGIQESVGINRSPWYRLVGTQAFGLDVWHAGSLLAPIGLLSVEFLG